MLGYVDFAVINTEFSKQSPTLTAFEAFITNDGMHHEYRDKTSLSKMSFGFSFHAFVWSLETYRLTSIFREQQYLKTYR